MCAHYEPPPPTRPRLENDTVMRFMPQRRLRSLDAFRGLTIAAMVLVNNPGTWAAVYAPLTHARWHGLTPTDVIFPFFLFIVGVAIPLSRPTVGRVLRRAAIIFALGPHIWRAARVYDPEGILSTVPAVATTLLGVLTGRWAQSARPPRVITGGLALAGALGAVLGGAWGVWFPVNKALWTSSYAVLTAGLALLVFAACYWATEVSGWRRGAAPFVVLGVNALALFFLSTLVAHVLTLIHVGDGHLQKWIFERAFAPWAAPVNASVAYAVAYVLVWWGGMWLLYRAGVRVRA